MKTLSFIRHAQPFFAIAVASLLFASCKKENLDIEYTDRSEAVSKNVNRIQPIFQGLYKVAFTGYHRTKGISNDRYYSFQTDIKVTGLAKSSTGADRYEIEILIPADTSFPNIPIKKYVVEKVDNPTPNTFFGGGSNFSMPYEVVSNVSFSNSITGATRLGGRYYSSYLGICPLGEPMYMDFQLNGYRLK